jgi:NADPH2:quinone reductase
MQPAPKIPNGPPVPREARCVRLPAKAENVADIAPVVERRTLTRAR